MHDPDHIVWKIKFPLPWREPKTYKAKDGTRHPRRIIGKRRWEFLTLCVIWHHDPCVGGVDDSCATRRRLGKTHKSLLDHMGGDEARTPWFLRERAKQPQSPADAEALLRGALWHVARCTGLHRWSLWHRRLTFDQCTQLASELIHNTVDNVRGSLCLLPGYHTNCSNPDGPPREEIDIEDEDAWEREDRRALDDPRYPREATKWAREDRSILFFWMISRIVSRETARWWHEPKWHFWHWRFQFPLWQRFRRRFIERCSQCGVRYRGTSEVFTNWGCTTSWCGKCNGATAVKSPDPTDIVTAQDPRA